MTDAAPFPHILSPTGAPFAPPDDVIAWLRGKTPAELHAIEVARPEGGLPMQLFPDVLRYRNARGEQCEIPIMFRIPDDNLLAQATLDACKHVAKLVGRDKLTPNEARELVGATRFENFDTAAMVSLCTFEPKPPHPRAYLLPLTLDLGPDTIADAFHRIELLRRAWTVRMSEITEAQFWAFCAEVVRVGNIGPLAVLAPSLQDAFFRSAAIRLLAYRTQLSGSGSPADSMPA